MSRAWVSVAIVACLAAGVAVVLVPGPTLGVSDASIAGSPRAGQTAPHAAFGGLAKHEHSAERTPGTSAADLTTGKGTPILFCTIHAAAATMPEVDIYTLPESIQRDGEWRAKYYCPADFNKDDRIDSEDLALFMAVFAAQDGPMALWLDIDADGSITPSDLEEFINVFERQDCDPAKNAEYRLSIC